MERLTEHDSCYYDDMDRINELGGADILYSRLAELEDKLENGQLVELSCNVGDIIYVPYVHEGVSGIMRLPVEEIKITKHSIVFVTDFETDDEIFAIKFSNGLFLLGTYNDIWFTNKTKAEACLKKLQEEL